MAELLQVDSRELAACFIQEATVTRGIGHSDTVCVYAVYSIQMIMYVCMLVSVHIIVFIALEGEFSECFEIQWSIVGS